MKLSLDLYTNPMSRGRIARWMMEETGQPYNTHVITYGPVMKSAEYLAINPMGKVPALKHGENLVTECAAICAYMAETFPEAGLAPTAAERGDYFRWLFFTAGPVESAITNQSLGFEIPDDKNATVGYGNYEHAIDTLALAVAKHDYIAGDRFTAADVYVGSNINWGLQFGTIPKRSEFEDYWGRLAEREAFTRANQLDDADGAKLEVS